MRARKNHAFSLIEVVLALGVITFVLVAVLGLIPVGIDSFRASAADTRAAQMARSVFAILRTEPFDAVNLGDTPIDLATIETTDWSEPSATLHADNDGTLVAADDDPAFTLELRFRQQPVGLPPGVASEVHLLIRARDGTAVSQPFISIIERH